VLNKDALSESSVSSETFALGGMGNEVIKPCHLIHHCMPTLTTQSKGLVAVEGRVGGIVAAAAAGASAGASAAGAVAAGAVA